MNVRRKRAVVACLAAVACALAGVALGIAPGRGPTAMLLAASDMSMLVGGECNNTYAQSIGCADNVGNCGPLSVVCHLPAGSTICIRQLISTYSTCTKKQTGSHCEEQGTGEGCFTVYVGQVNQQGGCDFDACTTPGGTCGDEKRLANTKPCSKD